MAAPAIAKRKRWTPGPAAKIDWSHSMTSRLVACHVPVGAIAKDLVGRAPLPATNSPTRQSSHYGAGWGGTSANQGYQLVIGSSHPWAIQPPATVAWVCTVVGTFSGFHCFAGGNYSTPNGSPYATLQFGTNNSTQIEFAVNDTSSYIGTGQVNFGLGPHVVVGTVNSTATTLYLDGVSSASTTGTSTILYGSTSDWNLGWHPDVLAAGSIHHALMLWNRTLAAAEIRSLYADPFQFIRP